MRTLQPHQRRFADSWGYRLEILAFERLTWHRAGSKEQPIWDTFGVSPTTYYAALVHVLDDPAALRLDPQTVRRLQPFRDARMARRAG